MATSAKVIIAVVLSAHCIAALSTGSPATSTPSKALLKSNKVPVNSSQPTQGSTQNIKTSSPAARTTRPTTRASLSPSGTRTPNAASATLQNLLGTLGELSDTVAHLLDDDCQVQQTIQALICTVGVGGDQCACGPTPSSYATVSKIQLHLMRITQGLAGLSTADPSQLLAMMMDGPTLTTALGGLLGEEQGRTLVDMLTGMLGGSFPGSPGRQSSAASAGGPRGVPMQPPFQNMGGLRDLMDNTPYSWADPRQNASTHKAAPNVSSSRTMMPNGFGARTYSS